MKSIKEDPRIIRTRNLIIDSFLALIREKDFYAISVKDITERATVNRATFYRHFPDKYVLLDTILIEMMRNKGFEEVKDQAELNEGTFRMLIHSFCNLVEELKQTFGRNYPTVIILMESGIKNNLIDMMNPFFESEETEQKTIISTMLVTSIYSAACSWISGNKKMSREAFFNTILPFLTGAVSQLTEKGNRD